MRDVIEGQKVFVFNGTPATVIRPPASTGFVALVEFADGTRSRVSTPSIYATQADALAAEADEKLLKLSAEIRDLTWKLSDMTQEHARLYAIAHPDTAKEPT